jgi:hypothetical protein
MEEMNEELKIELIASAYTFSIGNFKIFLKIHHDTSTITLKNIFDHTQFEFIRSKPEVAKIIAELMYEAVKFGEMKLGLLKEKEKE